MLKINNLHANVEGNEILKGINLEVKPGEVHAIMGPNGSGKSTLTNVLAGNEVYNVTQGEVIFEGQNLLEMAPEDRAREGIFLAFQYPVEIPGITNTTFLKTAIDEIRKYQGLPEISAKEFLNLLKEKAAILEMDTTMTSREVNVGFSGGEKKRNEILQLLMLNPKLALLDETDSGLDIDALRIVANGVNKFRSENNAVLLVTHYQRLLNYIVPDFVHVLYKGRIIKSGGKDLALELEEKGYDWLKNENYETASV
jgi:Fe-S cluster assembly ATP-binding protein